MCLRALRALITEPAWRDRLSASTGKEFPPLPGRRGKFALNPVCIAPSGHTSNLATGTASWKRPRKQTEASTSYPTLHPPLMTSGPWDGTFPPSVWAGSTNVGLDAEVAHACKSHGKSGYGPGVCTAS